MQLNEIYTYVVSVKPETEAEIFNWKCLAESLILLADTTLYVTSENKLKIIELAKQYSIELEEYRKILDDAKKR